MPLVTDNDSKVTSLSKKKTEVLILSPLRMPRKNIDYNSAIKKKKNENLSMVYKAHLCGAARRHGECHNQKSAE